MNEFISSNYPDSDLNKARLQSGLTYLIKHAEEHGGTWRDYISSNNNLIFEVLSKGGTFTATVNTIWNTCNCKAPDGCWHKSLIACVLKGEFPLFTEEINALTLSLAPTNELYRLYKQINGQEFDAKGFRRPLSYWKTVINSISADALRFEPDTEKGRKILKMRNLE